MNSEADESSVAAVKRFETESHSITPGKARSIGIMLTVAVVSKEVGKMEDSDAPEICPCCMERHEVKIVRIHERNIFKGIEVWYDAEYHQCDVADEHYVDERQISSNHKAMVDAYERTQQG